jgi:hypothetical protein
MVVVKGWNTQRCLRISGVARRGLAKSGLGGHAATYEEVGGLGGLPAK